MSRDLTSKLVAESLRPTFLLALCYMLLLIKHFSYIYYQKIHEGYKNIHSVCLRQTRSQLLRFIILLSLKQRNLKTDYTDTQK